MIIQYHTGKTDIVLVKVPEKDSGLVLPKIGIVDLYFHLKNGEYESVTIPEGNWQIVGNPFELSEKQWEILVDSIPSFDYTEVGYYKNYSPNVFQSAFSFLKSKDSGISLLNHLKVYRINPLNSDPNLLNMYPEWQEAEERTGNWILLTAVKA